MTCHDDEAVPFVLHHLDQCRDRFLAAVLLRVGCERKRFVDDENPAFRRRDDLPDLEDRLSDVAGNEVGSVRFNLI